ncbi:MAG: hypothetical protein ACO3YY_04770, partial [Phycisphaerales bacterium]
MNPNFARRVLLPLLVAAAAGLVFVLVVTGGGRRLPTDGDATSSADTGEVVAGSENTSATTDDPASDRVATDLGLLPAALAQGLELHHAEKGYVMCNAWLPEEEGPSPLPANASHQVGVGAFVLNRAGDRVLMVCERHGPASGKR